SGDWHSDLIKQPDTRDQTTVMVESEMIGYDLRNNAYSRKEAPVNSESLIQSYENKNLYKKGSHPFLGFHRQELDPPPVPSPNIAALAFKPRHVPGRVRLYSDHSNQCLPHEDTMGLKPLNGSVQQSDDLNEVLGGSLGQEDDSAASVEAAIVDKRIHMAQVTHNVEKPLGYQQPWTGFAIWHWLTMAGVTLDINRAIHKV
ncbi:hypothetical protein STEG23_016410, partial [Scotinomys teguina]